MSIFKQSDLKSWFNKEHWVDVSRPKKDEGTKNVADLMPIKGNTQFVLQHQKLNLFQKKKEKTESAPNEKTKKRKEKVNLLT